jgi:hypothetical protein
VETVITVSVIIAMIMLGVLLIHLLNSRHNERIAAFHYSDALPGVGRRVRKGRQPASPSDHPSPPPSPEHHDGPRTTRGLLLTGAGGRAAGPHARRHVFPMNGVSMQPPESPPAGRAEVRIVAASPEVARQVAEVLRRCFDGTEQRSYPAGAEGGTRLHLTVDTTHTAEPARPWLVASRSSGRDPTQTDEV